MKRSEGAVLAALALCFLIPVVAAVATGVAFGYDEAVFAQLARHWLTGAPASGWDVHRPPGLSVIGLVPRALGPGAEWSFRIIGVASGLGVVVASWAIARRIGGSLAGITAAAALTAAFPLQIESASFLTDVPSTLTLLAMTAAVWHGIHRRDSSGWSALGVGALAAAAFYLRFAIVSIVAIVAGAAVAAPNLLRTQWRGMAVAAVAFGILLVPHLVIAAALTGAPWGILASAERAASGSTTLPILAYLAWFPWRLIGPFGAALALVAVLSGLRRLLVPGPPDDLPRVAFRRFFGVAVAVQLAVLGTVTHPEPRYVLFPITLLVILGAVETSNQLEVRQWPGWLRPTVLGAAAAAIVLGAVLTKAEIAVRATAFDWKREVGRDIASEVRRAGGPACSVLSSDVPIVSWYSGCAALNFLGGPTSGRLGRLTGPMRYVVIRTDGHLQPDRHALEAEILGSVDPWREYRDDDGRVVARVYRVRAAPMAAVMAMGVRGSSPAR